ncbi:MAG: hypothetical protein FuVV1_gp3 [Hangzhou Virga-like virus 1]|nr:MAG: hypothetical protein FuVV1_gp3 [Hangzhou Virga-like virus 1]
MDPNPFSQDMQTLLWNIASNKPLDYSQCISSNYTAFLSYMSAQSDNTADNGYPFDLVFQMFVTSLQACDDVNCSLVCGGNLHVSHPCREFCINVPPVEVSFTDPYYPVCCGSHVWMHTCMSKTCNSSTISVPYVNNTNIQNSLTTIETLVATVFDKYDYANIVHLQFSDYIYIENFNIYNSVIKYINSTLDYFTFSTMLNSVITTIRSQIAPLNSIAL